MGLFKKKITEAQEPPKSEYWERVSAIQEAQTEKGVKTYGQRLEDNEDLTVLETLTMLEEELIDGLMYIEHLKALIGRVNEMVVNREETV